MQIDKQTVITMLQEQGNFDQAQQAISALPQTVDLTDHAALLERIGIDPANLGDQLANHGELLNNVRDGFAEHSEGGFGGIIDKIKSFLGQN